MSETTAEEVETTTTEQPATETEPDWKAEAEKWKAHSRKNEATAKENAAKAKRLDEIEEANKSELEKVTARAEAAELRAQQTELAGLKASVALDKGLTPSQAKRLVGSDRESLEADADELIADLKNTKPAAAPSSEGQGKQGEPVGQTKQITSEDELTSMSRQEIVQARKDGRLNDLMGVKS